LTDHEPTKQSSGASQPRDAPQRNSEPAAGDQCAPFRLTQIVWRVWMRFSRDGCSLMAAATAFYGLICLIPLVGLTISVFGRVLGSTPSGDAKDQVLAFLHTVVPLEAPSVEDAIRQFPQPSGSWFVEAVSILGLLWASSRLFHTLEDVLTRVWSGHGRGRPIFLRNLVALGATAAAGLIFLVTMLATTAAALPVADSILRFIPALHGVTVWVGRAIVLLGAWLMFLLMYVYLPQERVRWREAAIGAVIAAVMWEISRFAFSTLVSRSTAYGRLYGSLAGIVVVTLWIYLTAIITLIGAEFAVVLQRRKEGQEA
jgi:membrane protein